RPEQAARSDARVEVDDLRFRTGIVVDVDSYEAERSLPWFAVHTTINALHEAHVGRNERISRLCAVRDSRLRDHAADVREADDTVEVGDGRWLRGDSVENPGWTWAVHVERAADRWRTSRNWERIVGRGRLDASWLQDCAAKRDAGGNRSASRTH